jgi:hypothetical protein
VPEFEQVHPPHRRCVTAADQALHRLVHLGVHRNSMSRETAGCTEWQAKTVLPADFAAVLVAVQPVGWPNEGECVCALPWMQLRIWLGSPRWSVKI